MNYLSISVDYLLWAFMAAVAFLLLYKIRQLYWARSTRELIKHGAAEHALSEQIEDLESGLPTLAAIASTAAFVGLAGTVVHIIQALQGLTGSGLDIGVISGPIAVALYATLKGLVSAIPAAAAYTLFLRRVQLIEARAERAFLKSKEAENAAD